MRSDEIVLLTVLLLRIYKEKCQALLEFLTPEDASAALYFDGRSFSNSIVKIRRPKDFVDVALFFSVIPQLLVVNCNVPKPIPAIGAVTVDGWLEVAYVPRGLFKNVNGCVSDSSNLMYFWRIRHGCGIKSEDSAQLRKLQHQHKLRLTLPDIVTELIRNPQGSAKSRANYFEADRVFSYLLLLTMCQVKPRQCQVKPRQIKTYGRSKFSIN
ncbi:hypothetical protein P3S68_027089 [Capsicum galapagoense]